VSEQITLVEARERLHARLWSGECAVNDDSRLAISGHRLWCALREKQFHAREKECRLAARDLTEALRRKLFSTSGLTIDTKDFTVWTNVVGPLASPPRTPYMTAVEAASFLAYGAFLTLDDIWLAGVPSEPWQLAEQRLFGAHLDGTLTMLGRKAPHLTGDPAVETGPVPPEFFAGNVTLLITNLLYDKADAARYYDIKIRTSELRSAFLAPKEPVAPVKAKRPTRHPTPTDAREFEAWARALCSSRQFGPCLEEAADFAKERGLSRKWARTQHKKLPDELRRPRGGRGSARYLSKSLGQAIE
jgi:hypothetical protein